MTASLLKTINYRGGVLTFRIPSDWIEEYDDMKGGVFYAPGETSGTLRLSVLTMGAPPGKSVTSQTPAEILSSESKQYHVPIFPLRENVAMIRYDFPTVEQGQQLRVRFWRVAQ